MVELKDSATQADLPDQTTSAACGTPKAKLFAFGLTPTGYISVGVVPMGVLAIGIVPMGVISFGIVAMGTIATGLVSMGVVAFGGQTMSLFNFGRSQTGGIELRSEPHHHPGTPPDTQSPMQKMPNQESHHRSHH